MTGKELKKKLLEHGLSAGKEGEELGVFHFNVYELFYGKIYVKIYQVKIDLLKKRVYNNYIYVKLYKFL